MGEAATSFELIIYETDSGALFYDSDGVGGAARIQFATLSPNLALGRLDERFAPVRANIGQMSNIIRRSVSWWGSRAAKRHGAGLLRPSSFSYP